jgi:superfamily I DNA and/or RNA helicase
MNCLIETNSIKYSLKLLLNNYLNKSIVVIKRRQMSKTLETLVFDNRALRTLPIDTEQRNYVRTVNNSCFSLVSPTPLSNPELVSYSKPALKLIDIEDDQINTNQFVQYFSGNKIIPGSETASHCYCGHQFGLYFIFFYIILVLNQR